ncbi:MarR family transcriptional regulator [Acetobacterium bakii]|uniref:HTH marR-type domain-containing protein n=1 Tax=Acetobacterium bakii TaxID=52689 RepID=A0A0L6TYV5_9FIRM|nr:MarR family transcriptional regulator [Acetobacterium bakii]KNZ41423.1 hypothetical protein AKG39_12475 [Acetobacterium bakii]
MKKEKKSKKSDIKEVKDSKKETKKKIANDEKKLEVEHKKTKPSYDGDYDSLKKVMIDSATLYQNILVLPRTYHAPDGAHSLYPSELKALDMIGAFSPINLTQLANKLNISKSAVSKCSAKLLEKGLITKDKSETSVREVVFMLSQTGQFIYNQLEKSNLELFQPINENLSQLSPDEIGEFQHFFSNLYTSLTQIYEELQK